MTTSSTTSTTTPTRPLPLKNVETILVTRNGETIGTDSSDSKGTLKTINAEALSFGSVAPGETSETFIIYLKVPSSSAINNIRLGVRNCGDLDFSQIKIGVEIRDSLAYNIIPSSYFMGINETDDPNSPYNISMGNRGLYSSQYVYLNLFLPLGQELGTGTIRFRWFFDYA